MYNAYHYVLCAVCVCVCVCANDDDLLEFNLSANCIMFFCVCISASLVCVPIHRLPMTLAKDFFSVFMNLFG